jgi:phosphoglycolate phosphatase-like HAD superfamily hydrolase
VAEDLRIRCVAFDFDGTLVDSNAVKRQAYFEAARPADPSGHLVAAVLAERPEGDRYEVLRVVAQRAAEAALLDPRCVDEAAARLIEAYTALVEAGQAERPERTGATSALLALGATRPLYVNSATPVDSLRRAVTRRGWQARFRDVLGRPPDKIANLRQVLAREDLVPAEVAMVGDQQRDLDAARTVGCAFVAVASDGNDFSEPVTLVADLGALPAMLERVRPC